MPEGAKIHGRTREEFKSASSGGNRGEDIVRKVLWTRNSIRGVAGGLGLSLGTCNEVAENRSQFIPREHLGSKRSPGA